MAKKKTLIEETLDVVKDVLNDIEEVKDVVKTEEVSEQIPDINTPEWTPFIMKQFLDDEIYDGAPTVDGLRRLTHLHIGEIIQSTSRVVQAPSNQNGYNACVEHHITIRLVYCDKQYSGVADVDLRNTNPEFARFASATAETRAEARALRKALRLRHIVTAEELTDVPIEESGADGFITSGQINLINYICNRCNINAMELIKLSKKKHGYNEAWGNIKKIPYAAAQKIYADLNEFQRKPNSVPPEIIGYQAGWNEN